MWRCLLGERPKFVDLARGRKARWSVCTRFGVGHTEIVGGCGSLARIGIILASRTIHRWEATALDVARRNAGAVYPLVLVHSNCDAPAISIGGQWWARLDRRIQPLRRQLPDDPMSPVDARTLLEDGEWMEVGPPGHSMPASAQERLAAANLDAVLQIGCEDSHEEAIRFTSQGLWRHRHGSSTDEAPSQGLIAAFCAGQPAIASRLEAVTHALRRGLLSQQPVADEARGSSAVDP